MKKALLILLTLTMVLSMVFIVPLGASAEEEKLLIGSVPSDYKPEGTAVSTAEEFAAMKADGIYYLASDIHLNVTYAEDFTGKFDGNGKKVTTTVPLFDAFDGEIKNLTVAGNIVEDEGSATSEFYVGAFANIAGHTAPTSFINVRNEATITSSVGGMGGIVGMASNDRDFKIVFNRCANYGSIVGGHPTSTAIDNGGLVGYYDGNDYDGTEEKDYYVLEFVDCENYGTINAGGRPGGIIGYANSSAKFVNCHNVGDVQSTKNYCGGIAGRTGTDGGKHNIFLFENCVNDGKISVYKSQGAGIVGYAGFTASLHYVNCVNNGEIVGANDWAYGLGGMLGGNYETTNAIFENCVNNGKIGNKEADNDRRASAGMCGKLNSDKITKFVNCVNNGEIHAHGSNGTTCAAGMVGELYIPKLSHAPQFVGCINNGEVSGDKCAAGIVAVYGKGGSYGYGNIVFDKCGNTGNITAVRNEKQGGASGILAYAYCDLYYGPRFTACFNTGNVTGGKNASGLAAYINGYASFEYNYIAGNIRSLQTATIVKDGDSVYSQTPYGFVTSTGATRYFQVAASGKIGIAGDKVTFIPNTAITVTSTVADGDTVKYNGAYKFTSANGKTYVFNTPTAGAISISDDSVKGPTAAVAGYPVAVIEWTLDDAGTSVSVPTYDHMMASTALAWIHTSPTNIDLSKNIIAKDAADYAYAMGLMYKYCLMGGYTDGASSRVAIADFELGKVTYDLNKMMGKDVFYQNLDPSIFVVDRYPTTDASHAKVILSGGAYTNALFDMNDNGTTPPTGDITFYLVIALTISTAALAGILLSKKRSKQN